MDLFEVYDLLDKFDGLMILCCWAHCRRYFERALKHDRERAEYGMEQIGMLYSVETIADEEDASYERRAGTGRNWPIPSSAAWRHGHSTRRIP